MTLSQLDRITGTRYSFRMTGRNTYFVIFLQARAGRVSWFSFPDRSAA
jgi:hypothetical protein